jgi:catechol 2,3-dioxygenase-like lactoylglutathione lyase family enzyme
MGAAIGHIALIVQAPARTAALFAEVMGARIVADRPDDQGTPQTFAKFGGVWFVLVKGEGPAKRNGDHIAFDVTAAELRMYAEKLEAAAVDYFMARNDTALYFMDYDNHVFELDAGGAMDAMLAS